MELHDSGKTISFFSRIVLQIPTIALSTATMIAISRHLGPIGRGEVSQILLLASLTSSVICTPIFLNIMHLKVASEIKSYVSRSLFLFSRRNIVPVAILDTTLLVLYIFNRQVLSLENIIYVNLLVSFYFIAAQIRDLLLRFHKNKIYGIDFAVQMAISGSILSLLLFDSLTVSKVIHVFVIIYGALALFLLAVLKTRVKEFRYVDLVRRNDDILTREKTRKSRDSFSKLGVLFQLSMSKDLLFGTFLLSKADFGLMSALTSFWVVVRFLRPSAVIQVKLGSNEFENTPSFSGGILSFLTRASSAIYVQVITIGIMGTLSYLMTPILMGRGFKPSIGIAIAGTTSEILLMKCLYDLSTRPSGFSQNLFSFLFVSQIVILIVLKFTGVALTINLIWMSSCITYLVWQLINIVWFRN